MPRRLPPIAPRAPDALPAPRDAHINNLDDAMARVLAMGREPWRLVNTPNPMTLALWSALQRPVDELLARDGDVTVALHRASEATARDIVPEPHNSPYSVSGQFRPIQPAVPYPGQKTALMAIGERVVAAAVRGDMQAVGFIADRLEGKPGQRRGEVDDTSNATRERVRGLIEQFVRERVEAATRDPVDITPPADSEDT